MDDNEECHGLSVIDIEVSSLAVDMAVGIGEAFIPTKTHPDGIHDYILFLTAIMVDDSRVELRVPVQSPLGQALLNGDLSGVVQQRLLSVK